MSKPWKPVSSSSKSNIADVAMPAYSSSLTFCCFSEQLLCCEAIKWQTLSLKHTFIASFGSNSPMLWPSPPMQSKASRCFLFNWFLLSVYTRNILENILSSLAFTKGMTSNNSNMCNTLQHSFFVSMLRKTLFQSSKYVEFLLLFIRGTIKVFKTCQSSLITFKLQPFFDNKSLKWFAILISWSPNSLIFSVGQVCISSSETIFSRLFKVFKSWFHVVRNRNNGFAIMVILCFNRTFIIR